MTDIECEIFSFGEIHICEDFTEHKCMICQLRQEYNKILSLIISNINIYNERICNMNVSKFRFNNSLNGNQKEYIDNKLIRLNAIVDLLSELD